MKIAFIGLGIMGKPMAKNLLKAGHELKVYDISKDSVRELEAAGAIAAISSKDAAIGVDVAITMLPNSPHVKEAVCGAGGILEGIKKGAMLIDMSSIAPEASKEISVACKEKGVEMIDAPVSGGEPKAIDGTLSIMVGGGREAFEKVKDPILKNLGSSVVLCGDVGAGNTVKLVNQIIVACNIASAAEAFTLAKKAGVDPAVAFHAIKGGLAGSTALNAKLPMMLEQNFKPGFKIALHLKDLNNALETGIATETPLPLAQAVAGMLKELQERGYGQEDHSALARYYESLSGVKIES
ncbi:MAG: 2-hydroxy-3-oxopropionate reductase [Clostridiales bacterium]|jgi:2-hydroxy-3-oxopropionate reductase|nr:2-hydroxy-3-oxopropionate reductase [Clostridiales bacterium]